MGLVQSLLDYLALHGPVGSALFQSLEGRPISSPLFYRIIVLGIRSCGLDPTEYKGHSFRIGGGGGEASFAAESGLSETPNSPLGQVEV